MTATQVDRRGISPRAPVIQADVSVTGLMIGLPAYGGQLYDSVLLGLLELQREMDRRGIPLAFVVIRNESLIQRARNRVVAEFLAAPQFSHLLFIDADIGFTAAAVLRLLAHDKPLIGGLYRRKMLDRVDFAWNRLPPDQERRNPVTGAISCAAVATGFMLVRREVFARIIAASLLPAEDGQPPRSPLRYFPGDDGGAPGGWRDFTFALFDCWIDSTGNYLSEDYAFCRRWRDLGGDVWADPGILLDHCGTATFSADPMQHMEAACPPS